MLKYVCYYGNENCKEKRYYVLAATNKIDYITKAIKGNGQQLEIVSASPSISKKAPSYKIQTKDGVPVLMPPSKGKKSIVARFFDRFYIRKWLRKQLNQLTEKDDVIVYHSLGYIKTITKAKKKKNFNLILEVEEIYGDVINSEKIVNQEINFFKIADSYIFPTELLNKKINVNNKPHVIIHGTYNVENLITEKYNDGRIHCVYAGTFDPRKGGVAAAAAAGEFLDERFHVHIIGFGSENEKKMLITQIENLKDKTKCKITYDGLKSGKEYIEFIQSCHIGLSTQNPNAQFNNTSFPSKILSYMANGLRVVSIRIPAIEKSAINDYMYYYDQQSPEQIANAIKGINFNVEYNGQEIIENLDKDFRLEIKKLFKL